MGVSGKDQFTLVAIYPVLPRGAIYQRLYLPKTKLCGPRIIVKLKMTHAQPTQKCNIERNYQKSACMYAYWNFKIEKYS